MLLIGKYIALVLCTIVFGLSAWLWYQSNVKSDLQAENQAQSQTIKQQEEANQALNVALQQEREAVIEQQQENAKIEDEANAKAETIRTIIKTQPCARTRLPEPIEWMRK